MPCERERVASDRRWRALAGEGLLPTLEDGIDRAGIRTSPPVSGSPASRLATAGVFRLGGTIVGTQAFRLYEGEMQASFLIEILAEDRPDDLREAYEEAMMTGPHWRDRINATLKRLHGVRAFLE